MKCVSRSGLVTAAWLFAGLVVVSQMGLQYLSPSRCSRPSELAGRTTNRNVALKTGMRSAAGEDLAQVEGPNVGWGPTWTGKEVLPVVAIFGTLLMVVVSFDPWQLKAATRRKNTFPLNHSFDQLSRIIDRVAPWRQQRVKESQQQFVTTVALLAPVVVEVLTKTGGIKEVGKAREGLKGLKIGHLYEALDSQGNWWPVVAEKINGDESYTCKIMSMSDEFVDEPIWPNVWAGNCRKPKLKDHVPEKRHRTDSTGHHIPEERHREYERDHTVNESDDL